MQSLRGQSVYKSLLGSFNHLKYDHEYDAVIGRLIACGCSKTRSIHCDMPACSATFAQESSTRVSSCQLVLWNTLVNMNHDNAVVRWFQSVLNWCG
jgi:hypothetical protein